MELDTLYHKGRSGKIYSWTIWTEQNTIITEYGTSDGEKTKTQKIVTAKNIGKKNEISSEQQAIKEAKAQHKKKIDKGYKLTKAATNETIFLPMLATDYNKTYLKKNKTITFPVDVQPKLDGVRCLALWQDGEIVLMTRGGKKFNLPHIANDLAKWLPAETMLDGEIYTHGMSLQNINKLWKKQRKDTPHLKYCIFDAVSNNDYTAVWSSRLSNLNALNNTSTCEIVPSYTINTPEEIFEYLDKFEKQGYEGIIFRIQSGTYELGYRSSNLLKLKKFKDAEFRIIGYHEGTGSDIGTVIWECETVDKGIFSVRPIGTREDRRKYFLDAESFIGRYLTVKFQTYSNDKIPIFPVGITIREPEDINS